MTSSCHRTSAFAGALPNREESLQISDYEPCGLVDERFSRFVREELRMVQDGCMRQRLDRCHAHKCRKPQIEGAKLIAVGLEIAPEQGIGFAVEGLCVLELSRVRNLLRKHAV